MKTTVYALEKVHSDYDYEVIGIYDSFEKAKTELIGVLKEKILFYKNEFNKCEDNKEYVGEFITKLKGLIKNVEKATPTPYYTCNQLYISEHTLMAIQNFFIIKKMTIILNEEG